MESFHKVSNFYTTFPAHENVSSVGQPFFVSITAKATPDELIQVVFRGTALYQSHFSVLLDTKFIGDSL